eukprot:CAMPEP_0117420596 /NCGR_PEP_ID=MMETSP0758-20121206/1896_1 /TAXON_ID=63605 /ORGANISM="Percolomonas cosmopolitus, Strain AE-1 (ATCC 50343)" /LENGTH=149 /DNA_ID=CAMNT_0005202295 /DNA_START=128 /DNA_END=577 /DNA_ORIENTATION=+
MPEDRWKPTGKMRLIRRRIRYVICILLIFIVFHIAYGWDIVIEENHHASKHARRQMETNWKDAIDQERIRIENELVAEEAEHRRQTIKNGKKTTTKKSRKRYKHRHCHNGECHQIEESRSNDCIDGICKSDHTAAIDDDCLFGNCLEEE